MKRRDYQLEVSNNPDFIPLLVDQRIKSETGKTNADAVQSRRSRVEPEEIRASDDLSVSRGEIYRGSNYPCYQRIAGQLRRMRNRSESYHARANKSRYLFEYPLVIVILPRWILHSLSEIMMNYEYDEFRRMRLFGSPNSLIVYLIRLTIKDGEFYSKHSP